MPVAVLFFIVAGYLYLRPANPADYALLQPTPSVGQATPASPTAPPSETATTGAPPQTATSSVAALPVASPQPSVSVTPIVPTHISVPAIKMEADMNQLPTTTDYDNWLGRKVTQFGVMPLSDPKAFTTVTWWSDGSRPGETDKGLAILLGHTQIGGYGVFNDIGNLKKAEAVTLNDAQGNFLRLRVVHVTPNISKRDANALQQALSNPPEGSVAALVTCSGLVPVDPNHRSHSENTVVFLGLAAS